jgi:predicted MFS family arabinose efflux permease
MGTELAERQTFRTLGLAGFASMASMRLCDPMLLALGQEFQVTTGEASRVVSAFAVSYGVLQLFYGPLGDRFGKLRTITVAALVCALLSAITSMASDLTLLVFMRSLMGAAAAGIIPLSMAWIGDHVAYDRRQESLARLMGYTVSGMMAGLWFGAYAAEQLGWRSAFVVVSALFALAGVGLWWQWRNAPPPPIGSGAPSLMGSFANTWQMSRTARVRQVLAVTALEGALVFGAMAFIPTHLHQQFGMSVVLAGSAMLFYGVGGLLYSQLARRWLTWVGGERGLVKTGAISIVLGLLTLAWAQHPVMGVLGCLATGFGFYMLHNTLQVQATQMAPAARASAVTLFAGSLFLGQSCGVLLMAESVDRAVLPTAFGAAALGVAVLGFFVHKLVGRH